MKAIKTKYIAVTNTKPSRIKAFDGDGNQVTMSCAKLEAIALEQNMHVGMTGDALHFVCACLLCKKMNWTGDLIEAEFGKERIFVFAPQPVKIANELQPG